MAASRTSSLLGLPNELILHILSPFQTQSLLDIAPVCHRIHALVYRIILHRLSIAANLPDHALLLNCYPPSARPIRPTPHCTHLRTPGLPPDPSHSTASSGLSAHAAPRLAQLRALYSRFRPQWVAAAPPPTARRRGAGGVAGPRASAEAAARGEALEERVVRVVSLEGHELFAQLCVHAHLGRVQRLRGYYGCVQPVGEGVVRVWRQWLKRRAESGEAPSDAVGSSALGGAKDGVEDLENDESILWVDLQRHVGLRVKVTSREWTRNAPVLWSTREDDVAVSYEIEFEGTRTSTPCRTTGQALTQFRTRCTNIASSINARAVLEADGQRFWQGNRFRMVYVSSVTACQTT